jgi:hypothetical protein
VFQRRSPGLFSRAHSLRGATGGSRVVLDQLFARRNHGTDIDNESYLRHASASTKSMLSVASALYRCLCPLLYTRIKM